jgi:DinB superfamily
MDAKPLLQFLLNGSFNLLKTTIDDVSDDEWRSRPVPDANRFGFTLWHCARTIDWAVNRVARGGSELVESEEWRDLQPDGAVFGAGVSRGKADAIATEVTRQRAAAYVDQLRREVAGWFESVGSDELARPVDLKAANSGRPDYLAPAVWAEIEDLDGIPLWQFLARPSVSHIRVHYGEVTALLEAQRAQR